MMGTLYDKELVNALAHYIETGKVQVIDDSGRFFSTLENRFPVTMNRIDWSTLRDHRFIDLAGMESEAKMQLINTFINAVEREMRDQFVVVIGDAAQEKAYRFKLAILTDIFVHFFNLPQHTFVVFEDDLACINYTFEDELFFGYAFSQS